MDGRNTINLYLIISGIDSLYSCLVCHKQEADFLSFSAMSASSTTARQTEFCESVYRIIVTPELTSGCVTPIPRNRISDGYTQHPKRRNSLPQQLE